MQKFTKRALSLALAFVLCFGLVSGIGLEASAATVNYVTGNPSSKYQNVIKNWGTRGTTATFLYNADGLRIRKTVGSTVTNYTLHGKNIAHMTQGSNTLHFLYAQRFSLREALVSGAISNRSPSASLCLALVRCPEPACHCAV